MEHKSKPKRQALPGICAVATCKGRGGTKYYGFTTKKISFHRFPKDKKLAKRWFSFCRRKDRRSAYPGPNDRICSLHFSEDSYERDMMNELLNLPLRKVLKKNTMPCIFSPNEENFSYSPSLYYRLNEHTDDTKKDNSNCEQIDIDIDVSAVKVEGECELVLCTRTLPSKQSSSILQPVSQSYSLQPPMSQSSYGLHPPVSQSLCNLQPVTQSLCSMQSVMQPSCSLLPVTESSFTLQSVTESACCLQSVSESACSLQPVSESACSLQPVSESACSLQPLTQSSCSLQPVPQSPYSLQPVTQSSCSLQPVTQSSCNLQPVTQSSCNLQSVTQSSCNLQSVTQSLCSLQPVTQSSCSLQPVIQSSCSLQSVTESSSSLQSVTQSSCSLQPMAQTSYSSQFLMESSNSPQFSCYSQSSMQSSCNSKYFKQSPCNSKLLNLLPSNIQPDRLSSCSSEPSVSTVPSETIPTCNLKQICVPISESQTVCSVVHKSSSPSIGVQNSGIKFHPVSSNSPIFISLPPNEIETCTNDETTSLHIIRPNIVDTSTQMSLPLLSSEDGGITSSFNNKYDSSINELLWSKKQKIDPSEQRFLVADEMHSLKLENHNSKRIMSRMKCKIEKLEAKLKNQSGSHHKYEVLRENLSNFFTDSQIKRLETYNSILGKEIGVLYDKVTFQVKIGSV